MNELAFAFETARLHVFRTSVTTWTEADATREPSDGEHRQEYVARLKGDVTQAEVARAVVWDQSQKRQPILFRLYCEWMEVPQTHQRSGYGQELYEGIERHLKETMHAKAVSEAGAALLRKMNRPMNALAMQIGQQIVAIDVFIQKSQQAGLEIPEEIRAVKAVLTDDSLRPQEKLHKAGQLAAVVNSEHCHDPR